MYSEMSRDPTAMTFRLPEGETLKQSKTIHQKLEISYPELYKINKK